MERDYFSWDLASLREVKARSQAGTWSRNHRGMKATCWVSSWLTLSCSYTVQHHLHMEWYHPQWSRPPTLIPKQDKPHNPAHRPISSGQPLNRDSPQWHQSVLSWQLTLTLVLTTGWAIKGRKNWLWLTVSGEPVHCCSWLADILKD